VADTVVDVDALPPTQYLVMEVLAARWRLGDRAWTFPSRLTPVMRSLEAAGLVWWKSGVVQGTVLAGFTDTGREAALWVGYEAKGSVHHEYGIRVAPDADTRPATVAAFPEVFPDEASVLERATLDPSWTAVRRTVAVSPWTLVSEE